jgi:DNA-directed RNA polymerase specialized sigma24 family protein
MHVKKKDDVFLKLCHENWEFVYNIAFAICYDDEIARKATSEMLYQLGRSVISKKKVFNSNEWMQNAVTRISADILHEYIKMEIKSYGRHRDDAARVPAAEVDFSRDKIVKLCEDPTVNDECFRNLSLGEKTALSLICVHDMTPEESADYLKLKSNDMEMLMAKGLEKISGAFNLFGKISFTNI